MAKIDPTMKRLIDAEPADWAHWLQRQLGLPIGPFSVESPNLSTSADADRVFRVELPEPHLIDFEPEGHRQPDRPDRYLKFSVLLSDKTRLPVTTVSFVMTEEADSPDLTGLLERKTPRGRYMLFEYHVIRVWKIPPAEYMAGGIGLVPLAPLSATEADLPAVVRQMADRLQGEPKEVSDNLFGIAGVLMGLRFPATIIESLLQGVTQMENSTYYQMIKKLGLDEGFDKGRIATNRESILLLGTDRFGEVAEAQRSEIERIVDPERLTRMLRQIPGSASWDEVLKVG